MATSDIIKITEKNTQNTSREMTMESNERLVVAGGESFDDLDQDNHRPEVTSPSRMNPKQQRQQEFDTTEHKSNLINSDISLNDRQQQQQTASANQQRQVNMKLLTISLVTLLLAASCLALQADAKITFEKMTNRDFSGSTYYTMQNVSLFECLGWCKEETSCTSAVFSFVVNPFAALQETTCMLQNETQARQGAYLRQMPGGEHVPIVAHPQKATNLYFFNKIELQTEAVCSRLWAFERFPNRRLRQRDRQPFFAPNKEACQAACMNEQRFVCRSLEFNYITQQCSLNGYDRRSPLILHLSQQVANQREANGANSLAQSNGPQHSYDLLDAPGTDYFENACLLGEDICTESRIYDYAKIGMPLQRIAHFVELNYYPDKEMLVKSQAGCVRACTIEHEFICRSILYRSSYKQGQPNCALYHLDQKTFPDGAETFMSQHMQPLLDSGETSAVYLEAVCNDTIQVGANGQPTTITMPPSSITIMPSSTTPGGISVHTQGNHGYGPMNHTTTQSSMMSSTSNSNSNNDDRFMSSTSTLSPIGMLVTSASQSTTMRLPTTFLPPGSSQIPNNIQIPDLTSVQLGGGGGQGRIPQHIIMPASPPTSSSTSSSSSINHGREQTTATMSRPIGDSSFPPNRITISPAPPPSTQTIILEPPNQISNSNGAATNHDQNCDAHGFCYDVALKCTDTKMLVNVKTQRPFVGRIYALGRSETCNAHIKNQHQFQLDIDLTGQACNTQSASGTYTNTIVLQHHNVVLTKADKVYHVRCTYETASRNVSFGMMPVKDMFEVDMNKESPETISITASSDAPLPKISILTLDGREASTVRIGDRLTFRIEIPDNTPYGIFARSCIAMAKDARSTFEIIDENGCPVDHTIFPGFKTALGNENALESNYEAFRFTESYGVIFQCNVKYCIGKCEPVSCGIGHSSVDSYGRRKRSIAGPTGAPEDAHGKPRGDDMTLSREIVVLDLKEKDQTSRGGNDAAPPGSQDDANQATTPTANGQQAAAQRSSVKSHKQNHNHNHHQHRNHHDQQSNLDGDYATTSGDSLNGRHCLSSQSLFVLICFIGLFFVLYVCLVAYFFSRRDPKISPIKYQYH